MRKVYFSYLNVKNPTAIHPIFKDTLEHPPEGYEYVNREFFTSTKNVADAKLSAGKRAIIAAGKAVTKLIPLPIVWRLPKGEYDLAHVSSHLALSSAPWVFDYEAVHCITRFNSNEVRMPHVKAIVRRILGSKDCKHLIAMSEGARKGFVRLFPSLAHKTSVVYPAPVLTPQIREITQRRMRRLLTMKKGDIVTFLFAARYFKKKGGYEALEAFRILHEKHPNTRLLIVADIPKELKGKRIPGVTLIDRISREDMITKHYPRADVFIYPSFYDTFGYVILEAMLFGMPSISTTDNVIPELIDDGVDGLLVPAYRKNQLDKDGIFNQRYSDFDLLFADTRPEFARMAKDFAAAMERFVLDPQRIASMGKACFRKVDTGKFSMEERRRKLKEIYDRALQ